MTWKVNEVQYCTEKEILLFVIQDESRGPEYVCGVTRSAINDHFRTPDTPEDVQKNFEMHQNFIIGKASGLIKAGLKNDEGHFIIDSDIISNPQIA